MSRAREFADLASSADAGGISGKNLLTNGAMTISQRGSSTASVTTGNIYAACDRWSNSGSSFGTFTLSQSTEAPAGFANSFKYDCTTANGSLSASSHLGLVQKFEGQNLQMLEKGTSTAKPVTISFWVKSNKTGDYTLEIDDRDNTRSFSKKYTIDSADTWEFKSLTFAGDTTGTLDNDNANSFHVSWWLANGSNWTSGTFTTGWEARTTANRATPNQVNLADSTSNEWYITGCQMEIGEQFTGFEHRSVAEEERLCFRYYYDARFGTNDGGVSSPSRDAQYGHVRQAMVYFPVRMRAAPTISIQSSAANSMDRYGRGQETCYPKAENIHPDNFQNIVKYTDANQNTSANWVDTSVGYINRAGYRADAEL